MQDSTQNSVCDVGKEGEPVRLFAISFRLLAFLFLVLAWVVFLFGAQRAERAMSGFGPRPDVFEALNYDKQLSRHQLPFFAITVGIDVLALFVLASTIGDGPRRISGVLIGIGGVLALIYHIFVLFVTILFAG